MKRRRFWATALLLACGVTASACGASEAPSRPQLPIRTDDTGAFHLNIDGSELTRLPDFGRNSYPSPYGGRVAVVREPGAPESTLFIADADGSDEVEVGRVAGQATAFPTWSPDGSRLVAGSSTPGSLLVVNADGTRARVVGKEALEFPRIAWSPDGRSIAYAARRTAPGERLRIAVVDVEAGEIQATVTIPGSQPEQLSWSGDGRRLAFNVFTEGVFVVNSDGTGLKQLPQGPAFAFNAAISPDGQYVVLTRGAGPGRSSLVRLDVDTFEEQVLFEWNGVGGTTDTAAWSPDGEKIAFVARPEDALGIYIINGDGSGLYQLVTPFGSLLSDLRWLNDEELAFATIAQH